jgi:hypothetical protein
LLIKIRLGKWKSVFDQFKTRFRIVCDDHFHHIEAEKNVGIIKHSQPRQRAARDSLSFFSVYRREWPAEIFARARFYFDKDERVVVTADNIDFTATAPTKITEQNFVTATLQESAR